ncbi:MAG: hypothetical protein LBK47_01195 [Prevotellaceae bacterium]|jgi:hypothetical protein|nr:hypothetical protein [Prevotellaceae bacterium]
MIIRLYRSLLSAIFSIVFVLAVHAQTLYLALPCDSAMIFRDTDTLKEYIRKRNQTTTKKHLNGSFAVRDMQLHEVDSLISITRLQIAPRDKNVLDFLLPKEKFMLYSPEGGIFFVQVKSQNSGYSSLLQGAQNQNNVAKMLQALHTPKECVFSLFFLQGDHHNFPAIGCKIGDKDVFIDKQLNRYASIEDLIIGLYGSMEQYRQLHKEELYWRNILTHGTKEGKDSAIEQLRQQHHNDTIVVNKLLEYAR